jgi:hypothetical protein
MRWFTYRSTFVTRLFLCVCLVSASAWLHADQIELQNGDRYVGKVLSLTTNQLILQSDVLGTIKLPREKVAVVTLGPVVATNAVRATNLQHEGRATPAGIQTNSNDLAAAFRQLGTNNSLVQQVQKQFLSDASPEAVSKYNELLNGLMSGQISMDDLRAQAKSAADQLRSLKGETGDQTGLLDSYLSILDKFVNETTPTTASKTKGSSTAASQAEPEGNTP